MFGRFDPVRQLRRRSTALLNPEGMQRLGAQLHIRHHRQKRCCATEAAPFSGLSMAGALQLKGLAAAPDATDAFDLVDRQTEAATQRSHATGKDIAQARKSRQTGGNRTFLQGQLGEHITDATTRPDPHGSSLSVPADTAPVGPQIQ